MNNTNISNHVALKQRLMHLRSQKFEMEVLMERNVKEIYYSLEPISILKKTVSRIASDKKLQHDLLVGVLNIGSGFIIRKLVRSNKNIRGFISSLFLGNNTKTQ